MDDKHASIEQKRIKEKAEFEEELTTIEGKLNRLRVLYDQYFMGIERLEPLSSRNDLDKVFMRSGLPKARNSVLKFRYRSLQQRYTSMKSYWDRIVRMIEDGKIRRGIMGRPETGAFGSVGDLEDRPPREERREALASRRRRFTRRVVKPEEAAEAQAAPVDRLFRPDEVNEIYERLRTEKTAAGESTKKLNPQILGRSIGKMMERAAGKNLGLKVVRRDGKVSLVAVPIKTRPKEEK